MNVRFDGDSPTHEVDERRSELANPQRRLPAITLTEVDGAASYPVRRQGRRSTVVVLVHSLECADCMTFLSELASRRDSLEEWEGRLLVTVPERLKGPSPNCPFPVLLDAEARIPDAIGTEAPAVAIADPWGQLHSVDPAGAAHRFPQPSAIVDWLRYLAIQCPECQGEAL